MAKKDKTARRAERNAKRAARKSARASKKSERKAKRQSRKDARATKKAERKTARQERKATRQSNRAERKSARQEARADRKANGGGGIIPNFVKSKGFETAKNVAQNVAQNVFNKNETEENEEEFKMSDRTKEDETTPTEPTFFEKYKPLLIVGGSIAVASILVYAFRDKIFGSGKTDGVGYIEPIDLS